jgi:hypothetical protein
MILKTDQEFGKHCGVTGSAIYAARQKGKVIKIPEGYDTDDPINRAYALGISKKALAQRGILTPPDKPKETEKDSLEAQKLKEDIIYRKKMGRKLDLEHESKIMNLIPSELIGIWIGFFAEGIRNNFLNIGSRVARGDTELRDRIEKEIKLAIEKTIEGAERGLRDEGAKCIDKLEEK